MVAVFDNADEEDFAIKYKYIMKRGNQNEKEDTYMLPLL